MCGRYELNATPAEIGAHFSGVLAEAAWSEFAPFASYNIPPSASCPVIRYSKRDQGNVIDRLVWGFRPEWSERSWINARDDRLFSTPAFKDAAGKRRCLVIASGWYEWQRAGKHKQPYYVRLARSPVLAFAGIWTARKLGADDWELSFAIITTAAKGPLEDIHERMPLVLAPRNYPAWLDPHTPEPASFLLPFEAELLARAVSPFVNDPRHDSPECVMATDASRR